MKVGPIRIHETITKIAAYTDTPEAGVTRFSYSENDQHVRLLLSNIFEELDMRVSTDSVGNIRARYTGLDTTLPPLWVGSHIDSVRNGGQYDGIVGVVGAIEVIRTMHEHSYRPNRSIEVVIFVEEEGSNFGTTMVGSKCLSGKLTIEGLKELKDPEGVSCYTRALEFGLQPETIDEYVLKRGDVYGMLELHIEQGIVLEQKEKRLGVVSTIAGMTTIQVTIEGVSNHAGATPMNLRNDPMVAAATVIAAIQKSAQFYVNPTTVATVGTIQCQPGMANVIPKTVCFTVDIRDVQQSGIDTMLALVEKELLYVQKQFGVTTSYRTIGASAVYQLSKAFIDVIENKAKETGEPYLCLHSGAVHDCAMFTTLMEVGIIFVPSQKGYSHNPLEYTSLEDITLGCQLLLDVALDLTM